MSRVVIDEVLREKLKGLSGPVDLCDETGRVVAQVTLVPKVSFYVGMECPLTEKEIQDRIKNPGRLYTSAEVTEMLEKLHVPGDLE